MCPTHSLLACGRHIQQHLRRIDRAPTHASPCWHAESGLALHQLVALKNLFFFLQHSNSFHCILGRVTASPGSTALLGQPLEPALAMLWRQDVQHPATNANTQYVQERCTQHAWNILSMIRCSLIITLSPSEGVCCHGGQHSAACGSGCWMGLGFCRVPPHTLWWCHRGEQQQQSTGFTMMAANAHTPQQHAPPPSPGNLNPGQRLLTGCTSPYPGHCHSTIFIQPTSGRRQQQQRLRL